MLHVAPGSVFRVEERVGKFGLRRSGVSVFVLFFSLLCTMERVRGVRLRVACPTVGWLSWEVEGMEILSRR